MSGESQSSRDYVLGHSDEEQYRLQKQAELWHYASSRFLENVGIKAGMKVLDVGTGAGDVAMLLAGKVGPDGQVIGVDSDPNVLDLAHSRAETAGFTNMSFVQKDITQIEFARDFDAIVGRFILLLLREPVAVLASDNAGLPHIGSMSPGVKLRQNPVFNVRYFVSISRVKVSLYTGSPLRTAPAGRNPALV